MNSTTNPNVLLGLNYPSTKKGNYMKLALEYWT